MANIKRIDTYYERAMTAIKEDEFIFFIYQLFPIMGLVRSTFYKYFPVDSEMFNNIEEALELNKIKVRGKLMRKMYNLDNPTLILALTKLIGTEEMREALNTNYNINNSRVELTGVDNIIIED